MERVNLSYSTKNIPLGNERSYKVHLIEKVEAVIKRMRWKATFFQENRKNENNEENPRPENYGLKTANCPDQVKDLIPFEKDLIKLAKNIKFRRTTSNFQNQMKDDIRAIWNSNKTMTPADKTCTV